MEISKFRLQLSTALGQVADHLWPVRFKFRKLTRIAAERARKRGLALRPRKNSLYKPMTKSRRAIVATNCRVTKAKAQLSNAVGRGAERLGQLRNRLGQLQNGLRQAQNRFAGLTRSIAGRLERLAEECCAREDELRRLLATRFREGMVAANSKISNAKARLSIAFEKRTARVGEARNRLARLKGSITEKRQKLSEERRARKDELRVKVTSSPKTAVEGGSKVTRRKAQLSILPGQWTAHLRQAQNLSAGLAKSVGEKPQLPAEEVHAREGELRVQAARSQETTVEADCKDTTITAQPPDAIEQWAAHFEQGQNPLAGLARSIAEKPERPAEERREREDKSRVQAARPREAIVATTGKSAEVKAQLPATSEKGVAHLQQVRNTLAGLAKKVVNKRRRRRQELGARESQMRELLANSQDAIVVINGDRRFVTANRRALDLFGVSERNLSKFSIDVFLSRGQVPDLSRNGAFFKRRQERHGKCTIRRLDGSIRAAEFAFVTDFLPLHLCRFYDLCTPQRLTPIHHRMQPGTQDFSHAGQAH